MLSTKFYANSHAPWSGAHLVRVLVLSSRSPAAVAGSLTQPRTSRPSVQFAVKPRAFSTTPAAHLRDFFPYKDTPHIQTTPAAWPHPGYTMEEMTSVVPAHRVPSGFGDWAAWKIVRFARYCMDKATGMDRDQQVDKKNPTTAIVADKPLTEAQWVSFPLLFSCSHINIANVTDAFVTANPLCIFGKYCRRSRNGWWYVASSR